jgi:uncharacterized SAM-binding protein YcdF (DUF218 family)
VYYLLPHGKFWMGMGNLTRATYFIIFGAAVREDGSPSGTLYRRAKGAWDLSQKLSDEQQQNCFFIATGGQGVYGPREAIVIQSLLLELGARKEQIIIEDQATDTMQSVYLCRDLLATQNSYQKQVVVCSSPYHNYRCQLLLWVLGVNSQRGVMPSDRPALGLRKWLWYYFRECVAIPWDFVHILFIR